MRIIRFQGEGFKRLVAVDITPEGDLIEVRGDNGQGKSSVLDAIFAALDAEAVKKSGTIKPVRDGEEYAIIRLELGDKTPELRVTRYFFDDGTTNRLKVENADGAVFTAGQTMLDALVGSISFDPLAFARMAAADQATELRKLIKLDVDLDALARADTADKEARRDVNRDGRNLAPRIAAIVLPADVPENAPDKAALVEELAKAGETNSAIDREEDRRRDLADQAEASRGLARKYRTDAAELRKRADELDERATGEDESASRIDTDLDALAPLGEKVDTRALSQRIAEVDKIIATVAQRNEKRRLDAEFQALKKQSEDITARITMRAEERAQALAGADMPVEGLALARLCDVVQGEASEELIVTFNGVPFSQASGAEQLRVSTRIAMAANPKLRVLRVKDGSLLDGNGLKLLRELAAENDFQIWGEFVGEGEGVGVIMEAGTVKGAPEPEKMDPPKRRAKKGEAEPEGDATVKIGGETAGTIVSASIEVNGEPAPAKRKPQAMREITTPTPEAGKLL